jgi:hypothetical protein
MSSPPSSVPTTILFLSLLCSPLSAQITGTISVDATSNIFGAGLAFPPGGPLPGSLPPSISFPAGPGQVLTFPSVTGIVSFGNPFTNTPPDGTLGSGSGVNSNFNAQGGISGIIADPLFFLIGVFLTDSPAALPAPPTLNFTGGENFTELSPVIGQTFFIGDGLTGTGTGQPQKFHVPPTATRLFLGFADGSGFQGNPMFYGDNSGALTAQYDITGCGVDLSNRIPLLLQGDGTSWASLTYDNSNTTISSQGCALTSLSMALNFAGVTSIGGVQNTPGTLNTFMEANSLFTGPMGHTVDWDTTVARLNPSLRFDSFQGRVSSISSADQAFGTLDHFLCSNNPAPVIVGVRSIIHDLTFPFPGHFVLVVGRRINSDGTVSYLIRDPSGTATTLDDFVYTNAAGQPEFETRGAVR